MFGPRSSNSEQRGGLLSWGSVGLILLLGFCASCQRTDLTGGPHLSDLQGSTPSTQPEDPCPPPPLQGLGVVINEVMIQNETVLIDDHGDIPPAWVELFNVTSADVDLSGADLSDDLSEPDKWEIPCIPEAVIPAGGFMIIYLDGDVDEPNDLHASFIPGTSGPLQLVLNDGSDIVSFDGGALGPDVSAGRYPDGTGAIFDVLLQPTPGAANSDYVNPPDVDFIRGDVNEDGTVTGDDLDLLFTLLFDDDSQGPCPDRLDVNDDGIIDLSDAHFLALALEPGGPTIPAPYPDAGQDPTSDDDLHCMAP